jgi:hypothetical protein
VKAHAAYKCGDTDHQYGDANTYPFQYFLQFSFQNSLNVVCGERVELDVFGYKFLNS